MIRIATDVGGTFTDLVAIEEDTGRVIQGKVLTTPEDPAKGVLDALTQAGLDQTTLGQSRFFVHGGTTVINALLERKGARTAFLTTAGFRDVLLIGRGNRPDLYNLRAHSPVSFVPRHLCFEVEERTEASGRIRCPLSLTSLEAAAVTIAEARVEALAVMFLHSYANPTHEKQAVSLLRERLPGVTVVASHEVSGRWREYERGTTTVLTAYVQPVMERYLANLAIAMRDRGYVGPIYIMQSNAGLTDVEGARRNPLALVESGPAGGVGGAAHLAHRIEAQAVLHLDVGGTTAKCSLVLNAQPQLRSDYRIERTRANPGYRFRHPSWTSWRSALGVARLCVLARETRSSWDLKARAQILVRLVTDVGATPQRLRTRSSLQARYTRVTFHTAFRLTLTQPGPRSRRSPRSSGSNLKAPPKRRSPSSRAK